MTCLVVTFGSRCHPGSGVPSPAFQNTILQVQRESAIQFEVLYLLARANDWYKSGIAGLADSFDEAAEKLRQRVAGRPSLFVGNSMGGYAALAFGFLVPATRVLAFSPQTRFDTGERRWDDFPKDQVPVSKIMQESCFSTSATVVIGSTEAADLAYADDVRHGVTVIDHPKGGHDVVHFLRNKGELQRLLREEIAAASAV